MTLAGLRNDVLLTFIISHRRSKSRYKFL